MKEKIYGVHSRQVKEFLENLGLKIDLDAGNLKCICCHETITPENFGAMTRTKNGYVFACEKDSCRLRLAALLPGEQECS